jgi:hypothetical protein
LLVVGMLGLPVLWPASRRARHDPPPAGRLSRGLFCLLVSTWFGFTVGSPTFLLTRVGCLLSFWGSGIAVLVWLLPGRPGNVGTVAKGLLSICLGVLFGELLLRILALTVPSPLLATNTASTEQRFATYAFASGQLHFGKPVNSSRCFDDEFLPRGERRSGVVAVIGDSFSASYVPHDRHYTTLAEADCVDTAFWNIGWPAMGPAEYLAMLRDIALPRDPDVVVVSLFLGNDYIELQPRSFGERVLASCFDRGGLLLYEVPRRLALLASAGGASGALAVHGDLAAANAWLDDPNQEPGTMSEDDFLRIEVQRAIGNSDPGGRRWEELVSQLRAMRELVGERPFGILLIPDEYMVEDSLWEQVCARAGTDLQRDALRSRLVEWLSVEGIAHLDLLPVLRSVPPSQAGGSRHLYLLRDTHWNARGNAVAGAALATFGRQLLREGR